MKESYNDKSSQTKTYVEFFYPGVFLSESSSQEVESRDVSKLEIPEGVFGFSFYDITTTAVDGETLTGKAKNRSKSYVIAERVMTLEDVKKEVPNSDILQSNMKMNGWDQVARTVHGSFQPVDDNTIVIAAKAKNVLYPPQPPRMTSELRDAIRVVSTPKP